MNVFKNIVIMLLILSILASGCVDKKVNRTEELGENTNIEQQEKENMSEGKWFMTKYEGPPGDQNSEDARMSIIPHLRELGWEEGINVVRTDRNDNYTIMIVLPFELTKKSTDYMNKTLSNFSFVPATLNEQIENP